MRAVAIARLQLAGSFEVRALVSLLTQVSDLEDRESWVAQLARALASLQSSESGADEREACVLLAASGVATTGRAAAPKGELQT